MAPHIVPPVDVPAVDCSSLLSVRLVPSIALDYEARGIFPAARLQDRPGRVPRACDVSVSRETATAMLADARARPEQLKREQSNCKGGAISVWHTLAGELEWALLPKKEQSAREQASKAEKDASARGYAWFRELDRETRNPALRDYLNEFRFGTGVDRHLANLKILRQEDWGKPKCPVLRELRELAEAMFEAHLERELDAASWRAAGDAIGRAQRQREA